MSGLWARNLAWRRVAKHDIFVREGIQETAVYVDWPERWNGGQSNTKSWIEAFEAMAALEPVHVVPGHGRATTLEHATADTYDYLVNLRTQIGALIEEGGDIMDAPNIDQSAFEYLEQFDSLAGRNAQTTYEQMEWE